MSKSSDYRTDDRKKLKRRREPPAAEQGAHKGVRPPKQRRVPAYVRQEEAANPR